MNKNLMMIMIFLLISATLMATDFTALPTIGLEQARALALEQNPGYQASQASLEAAKWNRQAALSAFLPSLSFGASLLYVDPAPTLQAGNQSTTLNNDYRSLSLNLSQPLFMGGKLWQAYKMASASEEIARLNQGSERFSLISEVEGKYLSALQLKRVYQLSGLELKAAQDNMQLAEIKLQNGLLSRADHLRFQANLANKEVAQLQAQTALQLALQDLANYLGKQELLMPEEIVLDTGSQLIGILQGYDLQSTQTLVEEATQLLHSRNLNLKILDQAQELTDRAYKLAIGAFLPNLVLTGSRKFEENWLDRYEFDGSSQIMLNFSLPLLPGWGSYASLRKARWDQRKTQLEAHSASDGIKLGAKAAVINWVSTAKQLKSAEAALSYSEELYAQLQERFRQNLLSAMDLLDAELMLSAARLSHNSAYYSYLNSRSALMQLLALDDPAELDRLVIK